MKHTKPPKQHPNYNEGASLSAWREALNTVIFGSETPMGKAFDVALIICIVLSVVTIMLGSIDSFSAQYQKSLYLFEWFFTILFTIEYLFRLISVRKPLLYCCSFYGIIDLLSILPTYLSLLIPNAKYMLVIRILRLLRIFRVLKLTQYLSEAQVLLTALRNSKQKILVFLFTVFTLVILFGSIMYAVEGGESGFTSIPTAIYWAIVTMTTVGYGDIAPQTPLGQGLASIIMIMGYGIISVPTGIYSVELIKSTRTSIIRNDACPDCGSTGHDNDADFCKYCGHELDNYDN